MGYHADNMRRLRTTLESDGFVSIGAIMDVFEYCPEADYDPLVLVVEMGRVDLVERFMELSHFGRDNSRAVMAAVHRKDVKIIKALVTGGCAVDAAVRAAAEKSDDATTRECIAAVPPRVGWFSMS